MLNFEDKKLVRYRARYYRDDATKAKVTNAYPVRLEDAKAKLAPSLENRQSEPSRQRPHTADIIDEDGNVVYAVQLRDGKIDVLPIGDCKKGTKIKRSDFG